MDSTYRPQSPDLSNYAPRSPDLSAYQPQSQYQPQSPDLTGSFQSPPRYGHHHSNSRDRLGNPFLNNNTTFAHQGSPTSVPSQPFYTTPYNQYDMPPTTRRMKAEAIDEDYLPDSHRRVKLEPPMIPPGTNGSQQFGFTEPYQPSIYQPPQPQPQQLPQAQPETLPDPTLGVQLKTSFPVARIKRIMQADDDIGKVAQVTPHVVSRALELFMIKIISASAAQAAMTGGGSGKGPKRILAQHVKKALQADECFDFLVDIIAKVPDAPVKAGKKEQAASDSDEEGGLKVSKRKGKKRKESGDD